MYVYGNQRKTLDFVSQKLSTFFFFLFFFFKEIYLSCVYGYFDCMYVCTVCVLQGSQKWL